MTNPNYVLPRGETATISSIEKKLMDEHPLDGAGICIRCDAFNTANRIFLGILLSNNNVEAAKKISMEQSEFDGYVEKYFSSPSELIVSMKEYVDYLESKVELEGGQS